jgi:hypothetical protein
VSLVPFYISLGLLAAILILREWQNQRTIEALLNRLLEKHGIEQIPAEHPLAEMIQELRGETREGWPPKNLKDELEKKRNKMRVTFPVPGMDIMKAMLKRVKK